MINRHRPRLKSLLMSNSSKNTCRSVDNAHSGHLLFIFAINREWRGPKRIRKGSLSVLEGELYNVRNFIISGQNRWKISNNMCARLERMRELHAHEEINTKNVFTSFRYWELARQSLDDKRSSITSLELMTWNIFREIIEKSFIVPGERAEKNALHQVCTSNISIEIKRNLYVMIVWLWGSFLRLRLGLEKFHRKLAWSEN